MIKPLFLWLFLPLFILLCQPDFGSFCLITAVAMVMLFLAGLRARWFILAILVFAALAYFLVQNSDYRWSACSVFGILLTTVTTKTTIWLNH